MTSLPAPRPVVTVVQHGADVPLGRFAGWVSGVELRVVRAWQADLPDVPGDGLLVLGGRMSAHDDAVAPWLAPTRRLLADAVARDVPTLGICLGHQLLARATGGRVEVSAPAGRELGVVPITWCAEAADDPVLGAIVRAGAVARQISAHADAVVELPPGATHLAHSPTYAVQALRVGSALGVQFHPEASPERLAVWARRAGLDPAGPVADARRHDGEVAVVGRAVAEAFAAQVRASAGMPSDRSACGAPA